MTVLAKSAVSEYIQRPLDDWSWVKDLSEQDIQQRLDPWPIFKTDPYLHQLQTLMLCAEHPRFGLFLSMGTGKTKIAIDLVSYLQDFQNAGEALIVCFNEASVYGWQEEVERHSDFLTVQACQGTQSQKHDGLQEHADAYLMTYAGLFSYCTDLQPTRGKGKKRKRKTVASLLQQFDRFDIVVFDEVHKLMHTGSGVSGVCRIIADGCRWVYGMTGTPTGRDPKALFSEMLVIDQGESFGQHEDLFTSVFYDTVWVPGRGRGRGFPKRTINRRMTTDLRRMMQHRSISFEARECFDLPTEVRKTLKLPMTEEMRGHMKDLITAARLAEEEGQIRNLFIRYRQLTGGTLVLDGTEDSEKMEIALRQSPKVSQMVELVQESGNKIVVFYEFNATGDLAEGALKAAKTSCVRLWGGTKDTDRSLTRFRQGNAQVLLTQWRIGGTALNLQAADTVVFLESPCSYIERQQCEARIRPHLQTRSFVYDLVIARTLDERILEHHKEGSDLFRAVVGGKEQLFHS